MAIKDYVLNRDFIAELVPNNLRNTWVFENVVDIFCSILSKDTESSKDILSYYQDLMYYMTDFTKLTYDMKVQKMKDTGFGYLLEAFDLDEQSLNNILIFFTVIKMFKTRSEGLELILKSFDIQYEYSTWETTVPRGEVFTGKLRVYINSLGDLSSLVPKIQKLLRNYMAPLIDVVAVAACDIGAANMYFSSGYVRRVVYDEPYIDGDLYLTVDEVENLTIEKLETTYLKWFWKELTLDSIEQNTIKEIDNKDVDLFIG